MSLRLATPADIPAIFKVRTSVRENHMSLEELATLDITPETLPDMLQGSGRGWVVEAEAQIVAFAMVNASEATVFALFVLPDYEGQGIGKRLMHAAEHWLFEQGCTQVWLLTDSHREVRANGFYRHLGWDDDGIQDDGQVRFIKHLRAEDVAADPQRETNRSEQVPL
jgi:GNAT superfamily N-acetyltransferase